MTQTIEQLTARIAELEAEKKELQALLDFDNARLDQIEDELEDVEYLGPYVEGIKVLKTQLAAEQAYAEQLREKIEALWGIIDDIDSYGDMAKADDKLFRSLVEKRQKDRWETGITTDGYVLNMPLPHSTSALDAYVSEKVKEYQERLADALAILGADSQIEAEAVMLNYKKQVSTLTRQRDLAVEALKKALRALIHASAHVDNEDFVKVMMARDTINETLSTIKESEGK